MKENTEKRINSLQRKLMNLGFIPRALSDLKEIVDHSSDFYEKRLAARLLALWYGGLRNDEGARKCLEVLPVARDGENDPEWLWKTAIMEAECRAFLGHTTVAQEIISRELASREHSNLYLAAANLEPSVSRRMEWINKALALHELSPIAYKYSNNLPAFDCLTSSPANRYNTAKHREGPKVSVIMPSYNAEEVISTALNSLLSQTWTNLEVLVVDDHSTDTTPEIVTEYLKKDPRIKLIENKENRGPYVARNTALQTATGELVCCHDTDDWSHPEMIEKQVLHLMQTPAAIANISQQARTTPELIFYRRNRYGNYIYNNVPSFMFRRKPVMEICGYWDSVRFSADSELIRRVRKLFGTESVANLDSGPLCFQRQHGKSLTADKYFGAEYFYTGARKEYYEAQRYFHKQASTLYYHFPQKVRPFAVPEPMWPVRKVNSSDRRHFDVIHGGDFRLSNSITRNVVEEIKAQRQKGLRSGIVQIHRYHENPRRHINPMIRELLDGDKVQVLVYGEKVSCDLLLLKGPEALEEWQKYIPEVEAKQVHVITESLPPDKYDPQGTGYYINRCQKNLEEYFGQKGTWHPGSPLVRKVLSGQNSRLSLAAWDNEDWYPTISPMWWQDTATSREEGLRIGSYAENLLAQKWPVPPQKILTAFLRFKKYEVYLRGKVKIPRIIRNKLLKNWHIIKPGKTSIQDFLANLDVFVYFLHPHTNHLSARPILEAMAAGIPVICSPVFEELLGNAAIYTEPARINKHLNQLVKNKSYYKDLSARAQLYVKEHFGPEKHLERLKRLGVLVVN